jgi:serine/threonine-protein kinase HipA
LGPGFEHWLIKFDGVRSGGDRDTLEDPEGYGAVELAYALMARDAGIAMSECSLLEESGRRHFMTRRFDRGNDGSKRHMQSLGALGHFDFNQPGAYSYEQAFLVIRRLELPTAEVEQMFRRMVFNIMARNQDDHVKNTAFLMARSGSWELAPAFDITWAYKPGSERTGGHQMTVNGRRDDFTFDDLRACARVASLPRGRESRIVERVREVVSNWEVYAQRAQVEDRYVERVADGLRLEFPRQ